MLFQISGGWPGGRLRSRLAASMQYIIASHQAFSRAPASVRDKFSGQPLTHAKALILKGAPRRAYETRAIRPHFLAEHAASYHLRHFSHNRQPPTTTTNNGLISCNSQVLMAEVRGVPRSVTQAVN
jgi:hypothetical protein